MAFGILMNERHGAHARDHAELITVAEAVNLY
jgi:hypothetical protein